MFDTVIRCYQYEALGRSVAIGTFTHSDNLRVRD